MKDFFKNIYPYILIIVVVFIIKAFVITPIKVVGPSMEDTLLDGDIMLLNKFTYNYNEIERFDIVVVDYIGELIIKRVIGLPGDLIEYKDGSLYINGDIYEEPFLSEDTYTEDFILEDRIPNDYYFVVGDNRAESKDSRIIGLINKKDIEGKASYVLFPFNRFGLKK